MWVGCSDAGQEEKEHVNEADGRLISVYMILDRVSFRYAFIPVPYRVSMFVYTILDRVSFRYDLIPVPY